jgi:hypothetical protein
MSKKVQVPTGRLGETTQWLGVIALPTSSIGTGYYGNFYDTTTQTIASTTTAYAVAIGNTMASSGVSISAGTKIAFTNAGTYNIQFSIQFTSSDASIHDANVWLRKNGVDVAYSNGQVSIPNKHGAVNGNLIAAWNIMLAISAGDYLELMWSSSSTNVSITTIAAGSSPTTPISPGVILTVAQLVAGGGGGGGGVTTFTGLSDVPSSYTGQAGNLVRVNAGATGLEFFTGTTGTVTSVAATVPSGLLTVTGTPITSSGTLALNLATQSANKVLAGPTSGSAAAPTFRAMVAADLPPYVMSHLRRRAASHPARGGTGRTVVGATGGTPTGTVGNTADSATGSFQPWTSAGTSGSIAGGTILASGATGSDLRLDNLPIAVYRFQTDSSIANVRYLIGLTNGSLGTSDTPNTAQVILLRYSTSASDAGWVVYSADGTNGTTSASVGSIAVSTAYTLMFRAVSSSSVEVWLGTTEANLALVATVTSTLPAATTSLFSILQVTTLAAAARIMYFGHYDQSSI